MTVKSVLVRAWGFVLLWLFAWPACDGQCQRDPKRGA